MKYARNRNFNLERRDRQERIAKHHAKIAMLCAMIEEYETIDSDEARREVSHLKSRIRTITQMIKYSDVTADMDT